MKYMVSMYIRNVRGLLIPREANYDKIVRHANEYVENIPVLSERIKESLSANRLTDFEGHVKTVVSMLEAIYARRLKNEAEGILVFARRGNMGMCERKIVPFIANLLALSIEIQTVGRGRSKSSGGVDDHTVEFFTDILYNLNTVLELAEKSEFESALDILMNMSVLDNDSTADMLITALKAREKPLGLISVVIKRYQDKIAQKLEEQSADSQWKILIVDDRPEILETVSGYLEKLYKVFALTDGDSALRFLMNQTPDLFILDIEMPGMDGITLARKIRNMSAHRETPIIILTGNARKEYVHNAIEAGVDDFMVKPANKDMLIAKVFKLLS